MNMNMIFSSRYILNRDYQLCNDLNRAMLVSNQGAEKNINLFIHPAHAIMLSLFDGNKTLDEAVDAISDIFSVSRMETIEVVRPFIENDTELSIKYDGEIFYFLSISRRKRRRRASIRA